MSQPRQPFQIVEGASNAPASLRGAVVAIGNFDGVHRGHQEVLGRALDIAQAAGAPVVMLTFEPHPRKYFQPDRPMFVLTPPAIKAELLCALGFNAMVVEPFDRECASLPADEFIAKVLVDQLGVRHVVTGFDFHFGKGRQGSPAFLADTGARLGFGVTCVGAFADEGGDVVSSSRIRVLLGQGEVAEANGLLGYRYTVAAPVIQGQQLGRTIGFPTANMALSPETGLREGVYAVRLRRANGDLHDGVASFGRRPTVTADGAPLLETYVFDFSGDLYGETCKVSLFSYLRPELKFDGLEPMIAQIHADEAEARAILADVQPLSPLDQRIAFG